MSLFNILREPDSIVEDFPVSFRSITELTSRLEAPTGSTASRRCPVRGPSPWHVSQRSLFGWGCDWWACAASTVNSIWKWKCFDFEGFFLFCNV